ncbi:putative toxin-antitoxin system toxin component, PIN family [Thermococcus sp.]
MAANREKAKETRPRIVIDTSVLTAALLSPKGYAFDVITLLAEGKVRHYYSPLTKSEYYRVVAYPKVTKRVSPTISKIRINAVLAMSIRVSIKRSFQNSKVLLEKVRDPEDIPFLDVVYNSKAEFLITYDRKHLLKIRDKNKKFKLNGHEFYILTPEEFIEEFYRVR